MSQNRFRKILCSLAASAVIATGVIATVSPNANAETTNTQQYLAVDGVPTISASNDQLNLPFDPNLYYTYSLLSDSGKQVWDWALPVLLAFDPANPSTDPAVKFEKLTDGDGRVTFNLKEKGISAKVADITNLNNYFVWNEARMFILRDWGATKNTVDADGNVETIYFTVAKNWMGDGYYQSLLVQMEDMVADILANVDPRQNDAQRLNAFYDNYLAKENYVNALTPGSMPGAFINQKVICGGYSKGFEYLSMRVGVPAAYMLGQAAGGYHAWNTVKIDDANWYVIDSTWDDVYGNKGYSNRSYFLKGTASTKDHAPYSKYSPMPQVPETNYNTAAWVAPESVAPISKKAVDQIVDAVKDTFDDAPTLISGVTNVTVSIPEKSSSTATFQDGFFKNNLQKSVKALKLSGSATITISNKNGTLNSVNDVLTKGLTISYIAPGETEASYGYAGGQFIETSSGNAVSEADMAAKVLDFASQTTSRVLKAHSADVADISGINVGMPETVEYTPSNDTESKIIDQIKANLNGKFNGELSVMILGGYSSIDEVIEKGVVIGYQYPNGGYYTLMGGQVIAS